MRRCLFCRSPLMVDLDQQEFCPLEAREHPTTPFIATEAEPLELQRPAANPEFLARWAVAMEKAR